MIRLLLAIAALIALARVAPIVALIATALALWLWGVCTDAGRERDVTVDLLAPNPNADRHRTYPRMGHVWDGKR